MIDRTQLYLEDVLESQSLEWSDIGHLLVVGGSTRMLMVKKMLEEYSGRAVNYLINSDMAVALRAGILADMMEAEDGNQKMEAT